MHVCLKDNFEKVQSYEATLLSHGKRWIYLQKISSLNSALSYCAGCLQIRSICRESSLCFLTKTTLPSPVSPSIVASYRIIYHCGQVGLGGSSNTKISINADFYVFSKVEITVMILCHVKMSINGVIEVKSLGLDIIILNLSCCG